MDINNLILFIKKDLKEHKIRYDTLSSKSGIPIPTLKNIFSGKTLNPRLDTINSLLIAMKELVPDARYNLQEEDRLSIINSITENVEKAGEYDATNKIQYFFNNSIYDIVIKGNRNLSIKDINNLLQQLDLLKTVIQNNKS